MGVFSRVFLVFFSLVLVSSIVFAAACFDNDSSQAGFQSYEKFAPGTAFSNLFSGKGYFRDQCVNASTIREAYCAADGQVALAVVSCGTGFACTSTVIGPAYCIRSGNAQTNVSPGQTNVSASQCVDSDPANNVHVKGFVQMAGSVKEFDSCNSLGTQTKELFCTSSNGQGYKFVDCPAGEMCVDGACSTTALQPPLQPSSQTASSTRAVVIFVKDSLTSAPIEGALVLVSKQGQDVASRNTGTDGKTQPVYLAVSQSFRFELSKNTFNGTGFNLVIPQGSGGYTYTASVQQFGQNPQPTPQPTQSVRPVVFYITDTSNNYPLSGAIVSVKRNSSTIYSISSGSSGFTNSVNLEINSQYFVVIDKDGYNEASVSFTIPSGSDNYTLPYSLAPFAFPNPNPNPSPMISFNVPDISRSASNQFINDAIDFRQYVSNFAGSSDQLYFTILTESNSSLDCSIDGQHFLDCFVQNSGSSGSSTILVQVRDASGTTATDYFTFSFNDNGGNGNNGNSSMCSDIFIDTRTVNINEDSSETFDFTVTNASNRDFEITDILFDESSSKFSISNKNFGRVIPADSSIEVEFTVNSFSVSSSIDETAQIKVEGRFENRDFCNFSEISESFRVRVDDTDNGSFNNFNDGSSGSICSDVVIDDSRINLSEDDFQTIEVLVRNGNSRAFFIDFVEQPVESSSYFSASVLHRPDKISAGSDGTIRLRFETKKVSADQSGNISLRINGHFSNGTNCSTSQIREQIQVIVENGNSSNIGSSTSTSNDIDVRFTQPLVELQPGESKFVLATIENNSRSRKCMDLEFLSSSPISGELDDGSICISAQSGLSVNVKVKAGFGAMQGTYTGRLRAQVGSKAAIETLTVKVLGLNSQQLPQPQGDLEILNYPSAVTVLQNDSETISLVVSNNSNAAMANVSVSIENLPQGVFFQPYFRPILEKGEIATINSRLQAANAQPGQFDALLRISADGKTVVKPITVVVSPQGLSAAGQGSISGLVPLAGTIGVGILMLAVLVVIILVVVYLVRR